MEAEGIHARTPAPPSSGASLEAPEEKRGRGAVLPKLGDVAGDDDDEKCFGAILTHFGK